LDSKTTIHVPNRGTVKDVNVAIRLNHTDTADLVLALISPHAKYVTLTNRSSTDAGDNLGSGPNNCSGTPTTFDDSGALLSSGASPYAGHFQTVTSLSQMIGQRTRGSWQLVVIDAAGGDTGTLGCWKLRIKRKT
jgi:subtilisin-like proprotein convertase family protein